MNNITIIGRLTATPELKSTQSGVNVCSFTVAVDREFKAKSGEHEADFFTVVAWQKTAEFICSYFGKGQKIGLVGRLQSRKYEDKQGNPRTAVEVVAERVEFIEKREGNRMAPSIEVFEEVDGDDLPF